MLLGRRNCSCGSKQLLFLAVDAVFCVLSMQGHGTVCAAPNFDAENDAKALRKAMKGMGKSAPSTRRVIRPLCGGCFGVLDACVVTATFESWLA